MNNMPTGTARLLSEHNFKAYQKIPEFIEAQKVYNAMIGEVCTVIDTYAPAQKLELSLRYPNGKHAKSQWLLYIYTLKQDGTEDVFPWVSEYFSDSIQFRNILKHEGWEQQNDTTWSLDISF